MVADRPITRLVHWFRQREKRVIGVVAVTLVVAAAAFAAPPVRHPALGFAERMLTARDAAWTRRVERGEALLEAGAYEPAVAYLTALDSVFPARHVKHRRDRERERILTALGNAELGLGRNDRALAVFRRLVAFDPRNIQNHYLLASAALQTGETDEALLHFDHVLAILPTHLPALQAYTDALFRRSDYQGVVTAYERYLRAFRIHELRLQVGDTTVMVEVPVDSVFHDVAMLLGKPAGWHGTLGLETGGLLVEVAAVTLTPPVVAGELGIEPIVLTPADTTTWLADGTLDQAPSEGAATKVALTLDVPTLPHGLERLELRLRVRKPVDPDTWLTVQKSYRNLLDGDGMAKAQAASAVLRSAAAVQFIRSPE